MAIMRAGVTHWHAGKIEVGHGLICKAYGILMVTHGPNHAITRDLEVRDTVLCFFKTDCRTSRFCTRQCYRQPLGGKLRREISEFTSFK